MTKRKPKFMHCSARAYGTALLIEKYAAKYGRTPLQVTHDQITMAHQAGSEDGRQLMLEVYKILTARHCTDEDVRFIWIVKGGGEDE